MFVQMTKPQSYKKGRCNHMENQTQKKYPKQQVFSAKFKSKIWKAT